MITVRTVFRTFGEPKGGVSFQFKASNYFEGSRYKIGVSAK
jgi:hypothetical protein